MTGEIRLTETQAIALLRAMDLAEDADSISDSLLRTAERRAFAAIRDKLNDAFQWKHA